MAPRLVVMIHTVRSVISELTAQIEKETGVKVINMLDESLVQYKAPTQAEQDQFRRGRLSQLIQMAVETGADVIGISCSSMTPYVPQLRKDYAVPLVTVDEAAIKATVEKWSDFSLLATAQSTADIVTSALKNVATSVGKNIFVNQLVSPEMKNYSYLGDKESMRKEAMKVVLAAPKNDGIFLAQASTAWLKNDIVSASGLPAVTLTEYMIGEIKEQITLLERR